MNKQEVIRRFRKIYPESFIEINEIKAISDEINLVAFILQVTFPDGVFYFVVDEDTVSNSYITYNQALASIRR